jgi:creatinine amidohydrolase
MVTNANSQSMLEEMNAMLVKERINKDTVAVVILGACENHGNHMPFGSDFIFPLELAKRAARKSKNVLILPIIPYGVSLHHTEFQMTISLEPSTLIKVIEDIFTSLVKNGLSRILVINGHDGNIAPLELAARVIKNRHPEVVIASLEAWWVMVGEITKNLFDVWKGLGHGGEAETSAMLAVRPDLVEMNYAPEQVVPNLPDNIRIYWNFNELTDTGATGAPMKATAQKGQEALKVLENVLLSFINNMEKHNWKYGISLQNKVQNNV